MSNRIDYYAHNPKLIDRLESLANHITAIDPKLRALVDLRVFKINGCVYCTGDRRPELQHRSDEHLEPGRGWFPASAGGRQRRGSIASGVRRFWPDQ
jgi:alkylhydroperoxidase family enzyme